MVEKLLKSGSDERPGEAGSQPAQASGHSAAQPGHFQAEAKSRAVWMSRRRDQNGRGIKRRRLGDNMRKRCGG